jgi:hypothetical protein
MGWQTMSGYIRRALVESAIGRLKRVIGGPALASGSASRQRGRPRRLCAEPHAWAWSLKVRPHRLKSGYERIQCMHYLIRATKPPQHAATATSPARRNSPREVPSAGGITLGPEPLALHEGHVTLQLQPSPHFRPLHTISREGLFSWSKLKPCSMDGTQALTVATKHEAKPEWSPMVEEV